MSTIITKAAQALGLPAGATAAETIAAAAEARAQGARLNADREAELEREFHSEDADGLDPRSVELHLRAERHLLAEGISNPTAEQYGDALALAYPVTGDPPATANPTPAAGESGPVPQRRTRIDVPDVFGDELDRDLHDRAIAIIGRTSGYTAEEYSDALEQASKERDRRGSIADTSRPVRLAKPKTSSYRVDLGQRRPYAVDLHVEEAS